MPCIGDLTALRAVLLKRWQPLEHARADVGHSGSTTAILRQLQLHFDLPPAVEPSTSTPAVPHSHPQSLIPQSPNPTDAATEEADPSA
ncbi:hypothetical protein CK203_038699 [Vitis vinifera]|uniref:Uncharacterized protein n=1 Tax=Vitis vinifera TaxID=29760 RepID=A0A438HV14_VITVI|nr:hypothetical protein CK203_038699 [Vitis vinifera]